MLIMVIYFIFIFLKCSPNTNPTIQQILAYILSEIWLLAYFALVMIFRGGSFQFIFLEFSSNYFLVGFIVFAFCIILQYDQKFSTIWTILYYLAVHICFRHITIIFLHWNIYSVTPTATMKLTSSASSYHMEHLKIQWNFSQYIAWYCQSIYIKLSLAMLGLSSQSNLSHSTSHPPKVHLYKKTNEIVIQLPRFKRKWHQSLSIYLCHLWLFNNFLQFLSFPYFPKKGITQANLSH